jgi:hypothetical protein
MLKTRGITTILVVVALFGVVSIAAASDWDQIYNQHPNYQGMFTNREAWSATIVAFGPQWFEVQRYGEVIRLRLREGSPRLFVGQRVRMVPFARDGQAEIAELRLPDQDFRPVGVVRYVERLVPKEGPQYRNGGRSPVQYNFRVESRPRPAYQPPVKYRQPPTRNNGRFQYRR